MAKTGKKALSPWGVCSFLLSVLASHPYRFDTLKGEMANPVVQKWLSSQHPSGGGLGKQEVMLEIHQVAMSCSPNDLQQPKLLLQDSGEANNCTRDSPRFFKPSQRVAIIFSRGFHVSIA